MIDNTNRFYVYLHRRKDTDEVFYVGKGSGSRAYSTAKRSQKWNIIVQAAGGCYVEYFKTGLTENDALSLESELIAKYQDNIINEQMSSKQIKLNYNILSDLFYYDSTSPTYLRWKKNVGRGCQVKNIGDIAGYICSDKGYGRVWVDGKMMLIHRVVWTLLNGKEIPDNYQINHKDNNPRNNNIDNLELTTAKQNSYLKRKKAKPRIIKDKAGKAVSVQVAYLDKSGTRRSKNFPIKDSLEKTIDLANDFREKSIADAVW